MHQRKIIKKIDKHLKQFFCIHIWFQEGCVVDAGDKKMIFLKCHICGKTKKKRV